MSSTPDPNAHGEQPPPYLMTDEEFEREFNETLRALAPEMAATLRATRKQMQRHVRGVLELIREARTTGTEREQASFANETRNVAFAAVRSFHSLRGGYQPDPELRDIENNLIDCLDNRTPDVITRATLDHALVELAYVGLSTLKSTGRRLQELERDTAAREGGAAPPARLFADADGDTCSHHEHVSTPRCGLDLHERVSARGRQAGSDQLQQSADVGFRTQLDGVIPIFEGGHDSSPFSGAPDGAGCDKPQATEEEVVGASDDAPTTEDDAAKPAPRPGRAASRPRRVQAASPSTKAATATSRSRSGISASRSVVAQHRYAPSPSAP